MSSPIYPKATWLKKREWIENLTDVVSRVLFQTWQPHQKTWGRKKHLGVLQNSMVGRWKNLKKNIWIKRRKRRTVIHKCDKCEVYWNEARQDKPRTLKKHVEIVVSIGWFQTFTWKIVVSPIIRTFQHIPGTYPRPPTNSFRRNSFHLGLWRCLEYAPRCMLGFS